MVLCADGTTKPGDVVTGNYGQVENEGTRPSSGNGVVTGPITIENSSDRVTAWPTVFSGLGSVTVGEAELPLGSVIISH